MIDSREGGMLHTEPDDWLVQKAQEYLGLLLRTGLDRSRAIERTLDYMASFTNVSLDPAKGRMIAAEATAQAMNNLTGAQVRG